MIVYLHGFNSGSRSSKANRLRALLAPVPVFAPTYPAHVATAALRELRKFIRRLRRENPEDRRLLLIGSSLGGFWSQTLAPEFGAGMVLINPALRPDEQLLDVVGPQKNEATGEEYVLTEAQVRALARYRKPRCDPAIPTLVLLDKGDEVLDSAETEAFFRGCGETLAFLGGSHRFEHLDESIPEILTLYHRL